MPQHRTLDAALRDARRQAAKWGDRASDLAHEWTDELGARAREVRAQLPNVRLPDVRLPEFRRAAPPPPPPPAPGAAAVAVPLLLVAAGAGLGWAAWRLWSQSQARARLDAAGGAAGAADPEQVMAHNVAPDGIGEAEDPSAEGLTVPAEQVMSHQPAPAAAPTAGSATSPSSATDGGAAKPPADLLSTAAPAGLSGEDAPHLSASPTPQLADAVKPRAPRRPKPPEVSA